jgi:uncharacterized low-complexity protein
MKANQIQKKLVLVFSLMLIAFLTTSAISFTKHEIKKQTIVTSSFKNKTYINQTKFGVYKCGNDQSTTKKTVKTVKPKSKCGDGKCGDGKAKKNKKSKCGDGKCGEGKTTKAKKSKCGNGKCGGCQ